MATRSKSCISKVSSCRLLFDVVEESIEYSSLFKLYLKRLFQVKEHQWSKMVEKFNPEHGIAVEGLYEEIFQEKRRM